MVRLFLDTYEQVDQSTRSKMEEMLLTWRTGAPTGRELFGPIPQVAIERQIWGGESTQVRCLLSRSLCVGLNAVNIQSAARSAQPAISTAQVLSELEFVLSTKQRILQTNPYDKQTQNHVNVLFQVSLLHVHSVIASLNCSLA